MHEIELKFQIPTEARDALRLAVATTNAQTTRLRALYYDTPDLRLARAGMALRLRLEGARWVQPFKAPGGDALRRIEHEVQLDGPAVVAGATLDVTRHAGSHAGSVLAAALGDGAAPLKVIFETDVSRCHRVTHHGGAHIELALDVGIVRAGADELALHEIEFELVDGPVAGLLDLARCWVERHGLWLDVRSKAERGYLLAHGMTVTSATKAKVRPVSDDMATERALRQLVEGCLDHILPNAAALAAGLADDDHLEQAKLGLRKLHDALTPQIDSVPAGVDERWHQLLAELCTQLDEPTPPTPGIAGLSPALQIDAAGVAGGADPTDRANAQLAGRKDSAGAALRSPSSGALWLDLLAFAHPEQAS